MRLSVASMKIATGMSRNLERNQAIQPGQLKGSIKMPARNEFKAICSVTEAARKVSLCRTRFHQLVRKGIFPPPVYCIHTKRPFYPLDLWQRCMQIRQTGIGYNGQIVLFNGKRKAKSTVPQKRLDGRSDEFAHILSSRGLNVSRVQVKDAFEILYPGGLAEVPDESRVIQDLIKYLYSGVY